MVKHDKVNKEKKKNNSSLVIGIIITIVLVALVTAMFIVKPNSNGYSKSDYATYNGFAFEEQGQYWLTYVELQGVPYEAPFYNHPLDIQNISYDESITDFFLATPHTNVVIAVSDNVGSTPVLAGANIARITGRLYGLPTSSALYALPEQRDENQTLYPYVDCTNATSLAPIVWIHVNDTVQGVYKDQDNSNCIIVGGRDNDEVLASSDILAYKLLEII